jgi:hypothetical protein
VKLGVLARLCTYKQSTSRISKSSIVLGLSQINRKATCLAGTALLRPLHADEVQAPRPVIVHQYNLHRGIRFYLTDSPTSDNLVSASPGLSTMSPSVGSGPEKESAAADITSQLD